MFFHHEPDHKMNESDYMDVLSVGPYKPLAYMEVGQYNDQKVIPKGIAYIPDNILKSLLAKPEVYVITPMYIQQGDEKITKKVDANRQLILTENNESRGTFVFHMQSMLDMAKLNKGVIFRALNIYSKPLPIKNLNGLMTPETVIAFVKLISKKYDWDDSAKSIKDFIDICFGDPQVLNIKNNTTKLTPELDLFFKELSKIPDENREQKRFNIVAELNIHHKTSSP